MEDKEFKYKYVSDMFESIFGKSGLKKTKPRMLSKAQIERNEKIQKESIDFIKELDKANELTNGSTLIFK